MLLAAFMLSLGFIFTDQETSAQGLCPFNIQIHHVFNDDYNLMSLSDLESSIKANGHLPGMPSEAEVIKNGVSVGEMQKKMMQKIEELTLYVIELKKENERIKAQLNNNK